MESKIFAEAVNNIPKESVIFAKLYGEIVMRVNNLLEEKGYTQKKLAEDLDKRPSEINKWLNGEHNLTLKTIAKLQAVLEDDIINVPSSLTFGNGGDDHPEIDVTKTTFTVYRNKKTLPKGSEFKPAQNFNPVRNKRIA